MLNGLFDIYNRLEYLTENGDILPNLKKLVPWEDFRGELEVIYDSPYSFADRTCLRSHTPASGDVILRTIGISMAEVKLGLRNIAYNMDRFCTLMLQNA